MCSRKQFLLHLFYTTLVLNIINCGKSDILNQKANKFLSLEKRLSNKLFQCFQSSPACSIHMQFIATSFSFLSKINYFCSVFPRQHKAIPIKCFVSHCPTDPFFFGKIKKKNSESLVKKQVLKFTSTRSCLIDTNCLKLSSILRFCSLFRLPVIPSDYEQKDHVTKLSYLVARPSLALRTLYFYFLPDHR